MAKTYYYNYGISSIGVSSSAYTEFRAENPGSLKVRPYVYSEELGSAYITNNTGLSGKLSLNLYARYMSGTTFVNYGWKATNVDIENGETVQGVVVASKDPSSWPPTDYYTLNSIYINITLKTNNGTQASTGDIYINNNGTLTYSSSTKGEMIYKVLSNVTFTGTTTPLSSFTVTTPASTLGTFTGYTKNISTLAAISGASYTMTPYRQVTTVGSTVSLKYIPSEVLSAVTADYTLNGTTNSNGQLTFPYGVFGGNLSYQVSASKQNVKFYGETGKMSSVGYYRPVSNGTNTMYGEVTEATVTNQTNIYFIITENGEYAGKYNSNNPVPFVDFINGDYQSNVGFSLAARTSSGGRSTFFSKVTGATPSYAGTFHVEAYSGNTYTGSYNSGSSLAAASFLRVLINEDVTPDSNMFILGGFTDTKEFPGSTTKVNRYTYSSSCHVALISSSSTSTLKVKNYAFCFDVNRTEKWGQKIGTFTDLADFYSAYHLIQNGITAVTSFVSTNRSNLISNFKSKLSSSTKVLSTSGNSIQQKYYDASSVINLNSIYPEASNPVIKPADYTDFQSVKWSESFKDTNDHTIETLPTITYISSSASFETVKIKFDIVEGKTATQLVVFSNNDTLYEEYTLSELSTEGGHYYIIVNCNENTTYNNCYLVATNSAGSASSTTFSFKTLQKPYIIDWATTTVTSSSIGLGMEVAAGSTPVTISYRALLSTDSGVTWFFHDTSLIDPIDINAGLSTGFDFTISELSANTEYQISLYIESNSLGYGIFPTFVGSVKTESSYSYVDLGLSTQWCTVNIGASSAYDAGKFFAWGDTEGFDTSSISGKFTSSWYSSRPGHSVAADITPSGGHDAARVNAGSPWRMPTRYEFNELMTGTTKSTGTTNGIKYVKYTSKYDTSKYIIIPCDGAATGGSSLVNVGAYGYSWTSNFTSTGTPGTAVAFIVTSGGTGSIVTAASRNQGFPIRPVDEGPELDSFNVEDNGDGGSFVINEIELEATNSNIKTIQYQYLYGMGSGEWFTQSGYILNNSAGQSYFYNDDDWIDYPGTTYCYVRLKIVTVDGKTHYTLPTYVEMSCCFIAGTQVLLDLSGNTKNIEDIQSGDTVVSYNKDNGEYYITEVVKLIAMNNATNFAKVTLENGYTVTMNAYHPILTTDGWHSLTNYKGYTTLQEGDVVITKDGNSQIVSIERWTEEPTTMYNLDVHDIGENPDEDNNDNFIANGMVVHNGC